MTPRDVDQMSNEEYEAFTRYAHQENQRQKREAARMRRRGKRSG